MKKFWACIICILLLAGCRQAPEPIIEETPMPKQLEVVPSEGNWYDAFNGSGDFYKSHMELVADDGIDIISLVEKHYEGLWDIVAMNYSVAPCNLSRSDINYNDDMFVAINITKSWWKENGVIYGMFIQDEEGKYNCVYDVRHKEVTYPYYRMIDITGDLRQEVIIEHDDSGNGYTDYCVEVLSLKESGNMDVIFEEKLYFNATSYGRAKEIVGTPYFHVDAYNKYEILESAQGGYDIKIASEIATGETQTVAQGETIYYYDGERYVTDNYYDYNAVAQKIYDETE